MVAKLVTFSGSVQGVGFRYTAMSIARGFTVAGYVRNLPDGQVEMHVEGDEQDVNQFIAEVQREMAAYISGIDSKNVETTSHYNRFTVRY